MKEVALYTLGALVVCGTLAVIWATVRYQRYLDALRSGTGKKPPRVWKPFWFD